MSRSVVNHLLFNQYEKLIKKLYPKNEEIVRSFLSVANEEEKQAGANLRQQKKQKQTGEEISEIRGQSGYVAKPKIKKGWQQKIIVIDRLIYLALFLFKSNFFLCLPRVEISKDFGFSRYFLRIIIFAIVTLKNISRVFNSKNST